MAKKKYNIKLGVIKRWLRTIIPQIPAAVIYLANIAGKFDVPDWTIPTLIFIGTIFTALDKLLRELRK